MFAFGGAITHAARVREDDGTVKDFVPLSDFLTYAEANDHAVTIVIQLSRESMRIPTPP